MSEIEKMYRNAGIESEKKCYYWDCPYSTGMPANDIPYTERNCQDCNNPDKAVYPPFTAKKQLELIKWLGIRDEFNFYQNKVTKDWVFYDHEKDATHYDFELGLASWVNYIWQDLTEEERKQIKNILEG